MKKMWSKCCLQQSYIVFFFLFFFCNYSKWDTIFRPKVNVSLQKWFYSFIYIVKCKLDIISGLAEAEDVSTSRQPLNCWRGCIASGFWKVFFSLFFFNMALCLSDCCLSLSSSSHCHPLFFATAARHRCCILKEWGGGPRENRKKTSGE